MPSKLSPPGLAPIPTIGENWISRMVHDYSEIAKLVNADGPIKQDTFEQLCRIIRAAHTSLGVFNRERQEREVKREEYERDIGLSYAVVSPFVAAEHLRRALKEGKVLLRDLKGGRGVLDGWKWEDVEEKMRKEVDSLLAGFEG